jgi:hypothetical protein
MPNTPVTSGGPTLDDELARYWRYTTLYEDIEAVLNNAAGFMLNRGVTVASLEELQDQVAGIRASIERAARELDTFERAEGPYAITAPAQETLAAIRDALAPTLPTEAIAALDSPKEGYRVVAGPAAQRLDTALADALSKMVPIEDLLTRMPLPYTEQTTTQDDETLWVEEKLTDKEMQRAIVDYYIGRPAKRRCAMAATAPGCLTNDAIEGYRLQVPTGPKDLTRHGDPVGYGSGPRFGEVPLYSVLDSRLVRVAIHYNLVGIRGLELTYKTPDGREKTIGTGAPREAHETKTLELAEDERLARVAGVWLPSSSRGRWGATDLRHIAELTFTTTGGEKISHAGQAARLAWPERRDFAFQPKAGEEIFALSGRLNQLRVDGRDLPQLVLLGLLEPVYRKTGD